MYNQSLSSLRNDYMVMVYALNDLKTLPQKKLFEFFSELLKELGVESYIALLSKDKSQALNILKILGFGKDDKTPQGASLLHYAASAGLIAAVSALLNLGYSNEKTKIGAGLGHYAALNGHTMAITAFLKLELFQINAKDNHGAGFLLYAARGGHINTIHELICKGLDKEETNKDGAGIIHYAVIGAQMADIEALIAQGHNPHALDKNGETSLHYAARFGKTTIITILIEKYGLNPGLENFQQQKIVDLAIENGSQNTIKLCSDTVYLNRLYLDYLLRTAPSASAIKFSTEEKVLQI